MTQKSWEQWRDEFLGERKRCIELAEENVRLRRALGTVIDQEQHNNDAETHMHDMADIARAALASMGSAVQQAHEVGSQ